MHAGDGALAAKWVIFDAMGVIFTVGDDVADLLVPFIRERNPLATAEEISEYYLKTSRGEITSQQLWKAVGLGDGYPGVEREYLDSCLMVDPEFRDTALALKHTYKLAVLSNDVHEWAGHLYRKHELNPLFETRVISGAVGYRKPQKEIFAYLLERIEAKPSDCVFVDDIVRNLNAATDLGFHTIRFARNLKVRDSWLGHQADSFPELPEIVRSVLE